MSLLAKESKLINAPLEQLHQVDWWQREDLHYRDDRLFFAGRSVMQLAQQFGTPSFVYSFSRIRDNLERLHEALQQAGMEDRYTLLYAMKANRFPALLTALKVSGLCGIDACSPAEVELAVSCGFRDREISFTAGSLSAADVATLSRYPGVFMDCDSIHAIRTWGKIRPGSNIGIRVNPGLGVSRQHNDRLQYAGNRTTKFGIYREQFDEALAVAKSLNLTVRKIHFHTGCGYLTPELAQWDQVLTACRWFIDRCPSVRVVNVGGGLGVPHLATDGNLNLERWSAIIKKHFGDSDLRIEVEPGEYIVKDSGLLLLSKTFLEKKRETWFLGVDAGFNIAPEPAYYQLPFQPLALQRGASEESQVTVVGNINEALDVWYEDAWLPNMEDQAYLVLLNAGAYSASMASNHCMRGQFREYLLL